MDPCPILSQSLATASTAMSAMSGIENEPCFSGVSDGSGLSALTLMAILTQAVALGWYSVAPSALGLVVASPNGVDHRHFYSLANPGFWS
jgi:hypothetical protein